MSNDHDIWHWQEPGTAWKGAGLYHITLTIPSREPLLGELVIPEKDPKKAYVKYYEFGRAVLEYQQANALHYPEIQVFHYCLMPDHLHVVWYVRKAMPRGIQAAVRGFWQGAKKAGRAYSYLSSLNPESDSGKNKKLYDLAESLRGQIPDAQYAALPPIFTAMPNITPMGHRDQLPATNQYIDMNPQRLATKRLKPGFFRVQDNIVIAGRKYSGVGNIKLINKFRYAPVHVHHELLNLAAAGNDQPLRDYMNDCVKQARQGAVMVSPFISKKEKEVLVVLLAEGHDIIFLTDNGFRDYYKPSDGLFDSVEAGHVLILSPWSYDPKKRRVSRDECVAMNKMAEEICNSLSSFIPESDSGENKKISQKLIN